MTAPYRKKLIEVGLPLVAINAESAREKSIRHGHPSTLHLWWARRPLAACRAVLFSSLVDDPDSDPAFHKADGNVDEDRAGLKRADLFNFIEELVMWENSNNSDVIRTARAEIARCVASRLIETGAMKKNAVVGPKTTALDLVMRGHCLPIPTGVDTKVGRVRFTFDVSKLPLDEIVNAFLAEHAPPVLDPFAGGGSIPLEAQRLGLRAYASDLNPVPVLINKALIEIPPKFAERPPVNPASRAAPGPSAGAEKGKKKQQRLMEHDWPGSTGLAEDVRFYGQWMRDEAEKRIGHLYPKVEVNAEMARDRPDLLPYVGQQLTVIAWLWARTIQCPNPICRARAPLVRSFWLSKKKRKEAFANPIIDAKTKTVRFTIASKGDAPKHTSDRTGARCLFCNTFIKKQQLRDISLEHGVPEVPLAIVAEGKLGRVFLSGDAMPLPDIAKPDASFVEQPITNDRRWFSPPLYGMPCFADLFTARQLVALTTFCELVSEARNDIGHDAARSGFPGDDRPLSEGGVGANAYADAVAIYLGFCVDKMTDTNSTLCTWQNNPPRLRATFGRQALAMTWDIAEAGIFGDAAGDFQRAYGSLCEVLDNLHPGIEGNVTQADDRDVSRLPNHIVISTDPPYYDNICYAYLSDYFYVWLRKSIGSIYPLLFATMLTPKTSELIASAFRHDGNKERAKTFFEDGLFLARSTASGKGHRRCTDLRILRVQTDGRR
jgi:putative DNA methylase